MIVANTQLARRQRMFTLRFLPILVASLSLTACVSEHRNWDGITRHISQSATVLRKDMRLHFLFVNGKPEQDLEYTSNGTRHTVPSPRAPEDFSTEKWNDSRDRCYIPVGRTELVVVYATAVTYSRTTQRITFDAVAGGRYAVDYWKKGSTWGAYLIDESTNQTIAEGVAVAPDSASVKGR